MRQAFGLLDPSLKISISYLELLVGGPVTGGVSELLSYVKDNIGAIRARLPEAPVLVLLDWDSVHEAPRFQKHFGDSHRSNVFVWPDSAFNPKLSKSFRGLERHMSDRIINAADGGCIGTKQDGTKTIASSDLGDFKKRILTILQSGISLVDLDYTRSFVLHLAQAARSR